MTATHASTGPLHWLPHAENFVSFTRQSKIDGILATIMTVGVVAALFIPFMFCFITPLLALTIRVAQEGFSYLNFRTLS